MSIISLIAAVDEQGGLGFNNQLLCHLPADLQYFKQITMGKPIIMGRKTFESIGRPLPGRENIVLSQSMMEIQGVTVLNSLEEAITLTSANSEVMIIGGAHLYSQSIGLAQRIYLTKIHHSFPADVFFPEINKSEWCCRKEQLRQHDEMNQYDITFFVYERLHP
ncbi:dihydrofolate reductase [Legionella worsleiensis]|uniref:Dihydrofolate reductase n=1 Tax=Legionella worsleiensis TaxID=45076 RepID=A0A0W1AJX1_9GAMM|nr:dihydrofolate reductase [Legionella worsleiensis]KTD81475.1 dihydrofolate reductase FolA [Legionella worsleiensis]STY32034.1 dihydrofolate reductase [Legionella worsleiensis]